MATEIRSTSGSGRETRPGKGTEELFRVTDMLYNWLRFTGMLNIYQAFYLSVYILGYYM